MYVVTLCPLMWNTFDIDLYIYIARYETVTCTCLTCVIFDFEYRFSYSVLHSLGISLRLDLNCFGMQI